MKSPRAPFLLSHKPSATHIQEDAIKDYEASLMVLPKTMDSLKEAIPHEHFLPNWRCYSPIARPSLLIYSGRWLWILILVFLGLLVELGFLGLLGFFFLDPN